MYMRSIRQRRLVPLGKREITLQGQRIEYLLKQSPRIRGYRLEVRPDSGLSVIVPRKYDSHYVSNLLKKKSRWILRHMPGFKPVQMPLFKKEVDQGDRLLYMGKPIRIIKAEARDKNPSVYLRDNNLIVESELRAEHGRTA